MLDATRATFVGVSPGTTDFPYNGTVHANSPGSGAARPYGSIYLRVEAYRMGPDGNNALVAFAEKTVNLLPKSDPRG